MRPSPPHLVAATLIGALATIAPGCAPLNYTHPREPAFVRCCLPAPTGVAPESLRVVSYNIRFAREVRRAIEVLKGSSELAGADVVLLQEMDAPGTSRIARALGMNSVYYPAVRHPMSGRDFGNAILSRWPIERIAKRVLPHRGRFGRTQRIAAGAQIRVAGRTVLVASFHLATPTEVSPGDRRAQADAIVDWCDASRADLAIVGGDLNDPGLARRFEARGFACPTRGLGPTNGSGLALDHILVRRRGADGSIDSLAAAGDARGPAGVLAGDTVTSDHFPVWARIPLAAPAPPRAHAKRVANVPGIARFAWIAPGVARGGQPDAAGLRWLKEQGFRTVISFRQHHDESERVRQAGLDFVRIPVQADLFGSSRPTDAQLARFFATVRDSARRPVFMHCARGQDRTGMFAALYRIEVEGWTTAEAIEEMEAFGYHGFYRDLVGAVREYQP